MSVSRKDLYSYVASMFGYIIYPSMKMAKLIWGQKPQFASWIDNLKHRYYFDGWEFFSTEAVDWRLGFASTGLG